MEGWTPNATHAPTFSPHGRLSPKRPFTGGRITEKDVLSLCEAAEMASRHAGTEVTEGDFIRAAARAEITLKVVCPRAAVMLPQLPGGQNLPIPSGGLVNLPWGGAQGLAATGTARWRTIAGARTANELGPPMSLMCEGQIGFFDEWALAPDEPDLVATREDCRVSGVYVMALADAFLDARLGPSEPGTFDAAPAEEAPLLPWKMRVQAEAAALWRRLRATGANPTRASIRPFLVAWCRANNVKTPTGINPSDGYLRVHVLSAKHWTPPDDG